MIRKVVYDALFGHIWPKNEVLESFFRWRKKKAQNCRLKKNPLFSYSFHLSGGKYWVLNAIKPFDHARNTLGDTAPQTVNVLGLP